MNSQRELAHQMVRTSVDELEKLLRRGSGGNLYLYIDIYICLSVSALVVGRIGNKSLP